jgi:hypothetical protein
MFVWFVDARCPINTVETLLIICRRAQLFAERIHRLSVIFSNFRRPPQPALLNLSTARAMDSSSTSSNSLLPLEPEQWRPNTRPKLQPGALLDIDQGPLYDILTEWLPIEAVCALDSALCQRWRRAEFLALLETKVLLFNREPIVVLTEPIVNSHTHRALGAAALNWVLKRGIHLASLYLVPPAYNVTEAEKQGIRDAVASLVLNGPFVEDEELIGPYTRGFFGFLINSGVVFRGICPNRRQNGKALEKQPSYCPSFQAQSTL